jgi:hypothetical protein
MQAAKQSWALFILGILLQPAGWGYWMHCVGPSWWFAYHDGQPGTLSTGAAAERVRILVSIVGVLVCIIAPFLSRASIRRKLLFSGVAAVAAIMAYQVVAFIVMFGLLGF